MSDLERVCRTCGKPFSPKRADQICCRAACRGSTARAIREKQRKAVYKANRSRVRELQRKYYKANRSRILKAAADKRFKWSAAERKRHLEYQLKWRDANIEKVRRLSLDRYRRSMGDQVQRRLKTIQHKGRQKQ